MPVSPAIRLVADQANRARAHAGQASVRPAGSRPCRAMISPTRSSVSILSGRRRRFQNCSRSGLRPTPRHQDARTAHRFRAGPRRAGASSSRARPGDRESVNAERDAVHIRAARFQLSKRRGGPFYERRLPVNRLIISGSRHSRFACRCNHRCCDRIRYRAIVPPEPPAWRRRSNIAPRPTSASSLLRSSRICRWSIRARRNAEASNSGTHRLIGRRHAHSRNEHGEADWRDGF